MLVCYFKQANAANPYSILGLGDIAAPGLLIAFMLRFDRSRSEKLAGEVAGDQIQTADKTYFVTCIASYVFGLTLTIGNNFLHSHKRVRSYTMVPRST
jgi:minor histocompatibility antigen H13